MKRIFGTKKEKPKPVTLDEASSRLTVRGDTLDEKIAKLDAQLLKHKENIKRARPGPAQESAKRRALSVLKQKKLYESQRDQLYSQQFNMDQTTFVMESAKDTVNTVQALKGASKEMRQAFNSKELNIDSIDKLQDELADMADINNEIQSAMAQNYALPDDLDEDELMGELDGLEDDLAAEMDTAGGAPSYMQEQDLPAAPHPAHTQPAHAGEEDDFGLPAVPQRN
ncbi:hypothetical protein WJX73_008048 [Symbiochloris irregularis]|uniref:Charged multivesicular body protein 5 n=1 Tax=Symbiochloris irregularis TaxID=706552 RepID=A0AAW1PPW8_9CHLO